MYWASGGMDGSGGGDLENVGKGAQVAMVCVLLGQASRVAGASGPQEALWSNYAK